MGALKLEITPRITGRAPMELSVEFVRALRPEDLPLLSVEGLGAVRTNSLKRLSDRHHALARTIAAGHKLSDAAIICNYEMAYIYALQTDPTFKELVNFYRTMEDHVMRSNLERLAGVAADALDLLQERMEVKPDGVSNGQLIEIAKMGADRTCNGPQSSSVQININANLADRLKAAREKARAASVPLIEGEALPLRRDE